MIFPPLSFNQKRIPLQFRLQFQESELYSVIIPGIVDWPGGELGNMKFKRNLNNIPKQWYQILGLYSILYKGDYQYVEKYLYKPHENVNFPQRFFRTSQEFLKILHKTFTKRAKLLLNFSTFMLNYSSSAKTFPVLLRSVSGALRIRNFSTKCILFFSPIPEIRGGICHLLIDSLI